MTPGPHLSAPGPDLDRLGRLLAGWYGLLARHRLLLTVLLLLLGAVFSTASARIRWQPDILAFFSSDSAEVSNLQRVASAPGLASQVHLDIHLPANAPPDSGKLRAAINELARSLRATGDYADIWTGIPPQRAAASYGSLSAQAPLLLTPEDLQAVAERLEPQFLNARFAEVAATLADPDGEIRVRQLQADPLQLSGILTERLQALAPASGATLADGLLLSADGRHAMMVLQPTVPPSNTAASAAMLDRLNTALAALRPGYPDIGVWVVGSHRGYVENASRIKQDVAWVSVVGSLAVAAAILAFFRRPAAVFICMLPPTIGVGLALGCAGLAHVELPLIVLGFGGLLCGSTTDYGIQLIAACNRAARDPSGWSPRIPAQVTRQLFGPISMSVATSVTGFAALAFSAAPGLRALGLFVAAATLCIWAITFLVLPAYLGPWVLRKAAAPRPPGEVQRYLRLGAALLFLFATGYGLAAAVHIRFNTDPRSLDGSSAAQLADQQAFFNVWGDLRNPGIVVIENGSPDLALTQLGHITHYLARQQHDGLLAGVLSPAAILPDALSLEQAAARWRAFWTPERRTALDATLAAAAKQNGFKPASWEAYAERVAEPPPPAPAAERLAASPAALMPGLIRMAPDRTTCAAIVQMRTDVSPRMATAWAGELRLRYPAATVISGHSLFFDSADRARAEAERLAPWCLLAILLPLWAYFRRIGLAAAAALALVVGLIWVLGAANASMAVGGGLNLLSLVPLLFTLGVAVDYGIYAASDPANRHIVPTGTRGPATALCAVTTILGTGALALAGHPVLRWLGITLIAGVTGGYLASFLLVGPLVRTFAAAPRHFVTRWGWRLARGVLVLCLLLLAVPPVGEWILSRQRPRDATPLPADPLVQTSAEIWTVGSSWMRRREAAGGEGLWELSLSGSPEQIGAAASRLGGPIDLRIENEMLDQFDRLVPNLWSRYLISRAVAVNLLDLPGYVPAELQREIDAAGRAWPDPHRYLAPTYPRLLSYHALHDISQMLIDNPLIVAPSPACTGVVSLPDFSSQQPGGHLWLARNFDFEGGESFGRQKSLTYVFPNRGIPFATVAWPGLSGCITGINKEKIALFINAAATRDLARIGTPTIFVAREVLQHARTLDEAEQIVRKAKVFVSDIIVLADGKTGQARVLEKSPADTAAWDVRSSAVIANHLVSPRFAADPVNRQRMDGGTTLQRWDRARELLDRSAGQVTPESLAALLRDKQGLHDKPLGLGNRNAIDALIATHSVILDVTAGKLYVAAWPHADGPFIACDVAAMFERPGLAGLQVTSPERDLPAEAIMTEGGWERFEASREACRGAAGALRIKAYSVARMSADLAVAVNPDFYLGYELRGRAEISLGNPAAAAADLQAALDREPPYAQTREEIRKLLERCRP